MLGEIFAQEGKEIQLYKQAEDAYKIGSFDDAINLLTDNMDIFSKRTKETVLKLLALCYLEEDKNLEAEQYVSMLLKYNPYYTVSFSDPLRFADMIERMKKGQVTITTASQQEETLDEAPVPVTLITEEMIKMSGAKNLRDVLSLYVPGITPIEGEDLNMAMRGIYSYSQENILVLLNGYRLNSRCINSFSPDFRISLDKIHQIEVLRGPASSLYGNVALSAVINIITKNGTDVDGFQVSLGMGSNRTGKSSLLFGKRNLESNLILWASVYRSDGYKYQINQNSEDFYGYIPKDGYIYVDGYNHKPSYDIGLRYQWDKFTLSFSHQYSKRVYAYNNIYVLSTYDYERYGTINGVKPGRGNSFTFGNINYSTKHRNTSFDASVSMNFENCDMYNVLGDTLASEFSNLGGSFFPIGEYITDSIHATNGTFQTLNFKDFSVGGELKVGHEYRIGSTKGNLTLGMQVEFFNMFYNEFSLGDLYNRVIITAANERNYTFSNGKESYFSSFCQLKHHFSDRLIFNGGLRYDFKKRYNGTKLNVLSPRLSFIYLPSDNWNLKCSYSRSFVDAPYFYRVSTVVYPGSENLSPQYLSSIQFSSNFKFKPINFEYEINCFYNKSTDIVYLASDGYNNSGRLDILGIENTFNYKIPHFLLHGNFSYQYVVDVKNYSAVKKNINSIPSLTFNLIAAKEIVPFIKNLWLSAKTSVYSKRYTSINNPFIYINGNKYSNEKYEMPAYCIVDLGLRYSWKSYDVSLFCYNVFNTQYRYGGDRVPVLQPGRNALFSVTVNF